MGKKNNSENVSLNWVFTRPRNREQLTPAADRRISYHLEVLIELLTIKFVSQMVYTHSCHTIGPFKPPPRAFGSHFSDSHIL